LFLKQQQISPFGLEVIIVIIVIMIALPVMGGQRQCHAQESKFETLRNGAAALL